MYDPIAPERPGPRVRRARSIPAILAALLLCAPPLHAQDAGAPKADGLPEGATIVRGDDPDRLLVLAAALYRSGRAPQAAEVAALAYRAAATRQQRFTGAIIAAEAGARQEKWFQAQLWLRRADQNASTDAERARVAQRFRAMSARNPLKFQFEFSAAPSDNVNNGSETAIIEIGGLPFVIDSTDQQLGGFRAEASAGLVYRFAQGESHRTEALAHGFTRKVWLDDAARETAPEAEGSDFNQAQVALGIRETRLIWPDLGATGISLVAGKVWYGHEALSDWALADVSQSLRLTPKSALKVGIQLREERNASASASDVSTVSGSVEYAWRRETGAGVSVSAFVRDARSQSATLDHDAFGIGAALPLPKIGEIQPVLSARAESREFAKWAVTPDGRLDRIASVRVGADLPMVAFYGFIPYLRLYLDRTRSSVDIYDRSETSVSFGIRSRF